jgi:hypothetical protein
MARSLPKPGYFTSNGKDVLVVDPAKLSDTGEILTKDGNDANWRSAVAFRKCEPGSPLYVLSADVFDDRFHETTGAEVHERTQQRERIASGELAAKDRAEAESKDGEAVAEPLEPAGTSADGEDTTVNEGVDETTHEGEDE